MAQSPAPDPIVAGERGWVDLSGFQGAVGGVPKFFGLGEPLYKAAGTNKRLTHTAPASDVGGYRMPHNKSVRRRSSPLSHSCLDTMRVA